jgi:YHS domain-containing protein
MKVSRWVLGVVVVVAALAGFAEEPASDKVVLVESKNVCMINDRSMANEQIPVEVDGKTYFGCCPMCKERLVKDVESRFAIDPVSGKKVDKAKAVIGALPGAKVLYFESKVNLERYNAGARAESR